MAKKKKSFFSELLDGLFPILLALLIPVLILVNYPAILGIELDPTKNAVAAGTSAALLKNKNYRQSISAKTMSYLCAEASYDQLGLLYRAYIPVSNNSVSGWVHVKEGNTKKGLEWALWVNKYDKNTYVMVYAGTDQIKDVLQYIAMETSESYSEQMIEARNAIKRIPSIVDPLKQSNPKVYGDVERLYITGHSLGGYLAMFVASDIVDSEHGGTYSNVRLSEISASLELENMQCITFGAPGMYYVEGFKVAGKELPITRWQKEKIANNEAGLYKDNIVQYVNDKDIVANLLSSHLKHIGEKIKFYVKPLDPSISLRFIMQNGMGIITAMFGTVTEAAGLFGIASTKNAIAGNLYYHMIWVYADLL